MDPVTGSFALAGVCYQVGEVLIETYNTWKVAHEEVKERALICESVWIKTKRQLEFMQRVAPKIDDDLSRVFDGLLDQLQRCLTGAISGIDSVKLKEKRGHFLQRSSSRVKIAWVIRKEAIDKTVSDLEDWGKRFDPSWFFLITIGDDLIDQELHRSNTAHPVFQHEWRPDASENPLAVAVGIRAALGSESGQKSVMLPECEMEIRGIRYSDAKQCQLLSTSGDAKWYISNTVWPRPGMSENAFAKDARDLATKLAKADPLAFGLLNCKGVMPIKSRHGHANGTQTRDRVDSVRMIFRIPEGMNTLYSLRDALQTFPSGISQTRRLRIACSLARSISYMHTFRFVHKNVRPESVLCFEKDQQSNTFLVGFDAFRAADGKTNLQGDPDWERNLYRHPQRQHMFVNDTRYRMEHDMYSLGVCLLEIGLWESFVQYSASEAVPGKWFADLQIWLNGYIPQGAALSWKVKEYFTLLAKDILPVRMGDKYSAAVMACLTCLDEEKELSLGDGGDTKVAVHFIEEVMFLLEDIST